MHKEIINTLARRIINGQINGLKKTIISLFKLILEDQNQQFKFTWHPLGFIHLKLKEFNNGSTLRLHIWSDIERRSDPKSLMIHKHSFCIKSFVVQGTINNIVYEVVPKNTQAIPLRKYIVKYKKNNSILELSNETVYLKKICQEAITQGKIYSIPISVFHESIVDLNLLTCTIVVTHSSVDSPPLVAGKGEGKYIYKRESCHFSIIQDALYKILHTLSE